MIMTEKKEWKCEVCGEVFDSPFKRSMHIKNKHKLLFKDYYDKYLKKEGEGICPICGKETNFKTISNGYSTYCCISCAMKGPDNPFRTQSFKDKKKEHDRKTFRLRLFDTK